MGASRSDDGPRSAFDLEKCVVSLVAIACCGSMGVARSLGAGGSEGLGPGEVLGRTFGIRLWWSPNLCLGGGGRRLVALVVENSGGLGGCARGFAHGDCASHSTWWLLSAMTRCSEAPWRPEIEPPEFRPELVVPMPSVAECCASFALGEHRWPRSRSGLRCSRCLASPPRLRAPGSAGACASQRATGRYLGSLGVWQPGERSNSATL
jgi:hypothetical protein